MDQVSPVPAVPAPGLLAGKTPSTVVYLVAVVLFFLPFIEIRCNGMTLQQVSGFELATGFTLKKDMKDGSLEETSAGEPSGGKKKEKGNKKDPNLFALLAMGLAVLGAGLSFSRVRSALIVSLLAAVASVASLAALFADLKGSVKKENRGSAGSGPDDGLEKGLEDLGKSMSEKMNISLEFTPWFYITVFALLVAVFLVYKRLKQAPPSH